MDTETRSLSWAGKDDHLVALPQGVNRLLVIGIDDYTDEGIPSLENAVRDATAVADTLTARYGFDAAHQLRLFNDKATYENVFEGLTWLRDTVQPADNVVIYFAGHGWYNRADQVGYLIPADARKGEEFSYFSNSILVERIRAIRSQHTFVILDSCFGGALLRDFEGGTVDKSLLNLAANPSRWALTAGRIEEVEDGFSGTNSPFAQAVLRYFETSPEVAFPISELIQYVKRTVPNNANQQPHAGVLFKTGDLAGEMIFRRKAEKRVPQEVTAVANGVSFDLKFIKGGTFQMGDVLGDKVVENETVHSATVGDFYLAETAVTQALYQAVMQANPSSFQHDHGLPVEMVSWLDAQAFVERLNNLVAFPEASPIGTPLGEGNTKFRLPTEAEWEYAAREGGKSVRFGNGKDIADPEAINFNGGAEYCMPYSLPGEYRGNTAPVKSLPANGLGLHEMSGNVWEWCQDWLGPYPASSDATYTGPDTGEMRVMRGGAWGNDAASVRAAIRGGNYPDAQSSLVGFRLAMSVV